MNKNPDQQSTQITLTLPKWVVESLKAMEQNTQKPVDELVTISLKMFIATHNDYLGIHRTTK